MAAGTEIVPAATFVCGELTTVWFMAVLGRFSTKILSADIRSRSASKGNRYSVDSMVRESNSPAHESVQVKAAQYGGWPRKCFPSSDVLEGDFKKAGMETNVEGWSPR